MSGKGTFELTDIDKCVLAAREAGPLRDGEEVGDGIRAFYDENGALHYAVSREAAEHIHELMGCECKGGTRFKCLLPQRDGGGI